MKKSVGSFVALNSKAFLVLGLMLGLVVFVIVAWRTNAQTGNGPTCSSYNNRTTANGLGDNQVVDVYGVGNMVYAATLGGLSISTDGGATFANRTTANGLAATV